MKKILVLTACPAGVAHTYMVAEKLEKSIKKLGYEVKVETQGASGVENKINAADVKSAIGAIFAVDVQVIEPERFNGLLIHNTSLKEGMKDPDKVVADFLAKVKEQASTSGVKKETNKVDTKATVVTKEPAKKENNFVKGSKIYYRGLMTGISYMIPVIVAGGLLLAFMSMGFQVWPDLNSIEEFPIIYMTNWAAGKMLTMMLPILTAYIAFGIAGKPGIAPGAIGGVLTIGFTITGISSSSLDPYMADATATVTSAMTGIGPIDVGFEDKLVTTLATEAWFDDHSFINYLFNPSIDKSSMQALGDIEASPNGANDSALLSAVGVDNLSTGEIDIPASGFLGAMVIGGIAGFLVLAWQQIKVNKTFASVNALVLIPLLISTAVLLISFLLVIPIVGFVNSILLAFLESLSGAGLFFIGAVIGIMTVADMGGPINKAAYMFCVTTVTFNSNIYEGPVWVFYIASVMSQCIPGIALWISSLFATNVMKRRDLYTDEERAIAPAAALLGALGITEGAIPFAAKDPLRVIGACMIGCGIASGTALAIGLQSTVGAGGSWLIMPLFIIGSSSLQNVWGLLAFLLISIMGIIITSFFLIVFKMGKANANLKATKNEIKAAIKELEKDSKQFAQNRESNQATIANLRAILVSIKSLEKPLIKYSIAMANTSFAEAQIKSIQDGKANEIAKNLEMIKSLKEQLLLVDPESKEAIKLQSQIEKLNETTPKDKSAALSKWTGRLDLFQSSQSILAIDADYSVKEIVGMCQSFVKEIATKNIANKDMVANHLLIAIDQIKQVVSMDALIASNKQKLAAGIF